MANGAGRVWCKPLQNKHLEQIFIAKSVPRNKKSQRLEYGHGKIGNALQYATLGVFLG